MMKKTRHLFLSLVLAFFLFGLIGHVIPAFQECCCFDDSIGNVEERASNNYEAEPCLVCQLETGIYSEVLPPLNTLDKADLESHSELSKFNLISQLFRPPILAN